MSSDQQRIIAKPVSRIAGRIRVPGDKSISHRALMLGAIAAGPSRIRGLLRGEDCLATLAAMRALAVPIDDHGEEIVVNGVGIDGLGAPRRALDLGNSGTAMRLFAGLLAGQVFDSELTGDASLRRRPMERVAGPLRLMGAAIETHEGCPPIVIHGERRLHGIDYALPMASAQVKSALLLAGLYASGTTTVRSPAVTRDHTERMLESMGAPIERGGADTVSISKARRLEPVDIDVPGDFSSAAFFVVAACLGADDGLVIEQVGINASRTGLLSILERMGANIEIRNRRSAGAEPVADLVVHKSDLQGVDVPSELVALAIDEFPVLFVAAAAARGTTRVSGADELRHKESDRLAVMARALRSLGSNVEEVADGLLVHGGDLAGGRVDSCGDHRVAMALVVASLVAASDIEVLNTREVATSFPNFVELARETGFGLDTARETGD